MEGTESVFGAGEETLYAEGLQEDVELPDAKALRAGGPPAGDAGPSARRVDGRGSRARNQRRRVNKKKNRKKKNGGAVSSITDADRFVIDTCRCLKEWKSYLVWNAVGCLGVSAFSNLGKEVETIQSCGGQTTADTRHFCIGGGILWNILKTCEPNLYKEIMAKGRESRSNSCKQTVNR
ncbi:uncharacterized protein [Elaeis guineensis]|uniref:Phosphorylated adapter RNA export protein n=1 Tax=Elaeis guineensis var. tenera TaxID=51953 RepID=A0A6J0PNZ4_ELAGV|nr:uncharacterized protein LOC105038858 isoform X2 [Elaeis guineensis]